MPKKILLGMLVANGDCLMATVLAKQIKKDYPGCHLTWAISNICRSVIELNPFVDSVWEIELKDKKAAEKEAWYSFQQEALLRKEKEEFDLLFFTQIYPSNVHCFDGTTRSTIYNAYPGKITVDAVPVLRLNNEEILTVSEFAANNRLQQYKHVILFECTAFSGQSFVTPEWAIHVSEQLVTLFDDLLIILSTHLPLATPHDRIIVANQLSLRENAELTKHCSLLVGCSSGISWIATTDWAKRLPMIQFLKRGIGFTFASLAYDHRYWKLDETRILETTNSDTKAAVSLIAMSLDKGIEKIKPLYHQDLKPRFLSMLKYAFMFFRRGKFAKSWNICRNFMLRNYFRKHYPF
ncbi:MAG TPA: hypothetical protein VFV31_15795 [Chitinophagaceae bacterium]|nr:hypothetical protein [Chitinophagaceae bacterium]